MARTQAPASDTAAPRAKKRARSAREAAIVRDAKTIRTLVGKHAKDFIAADKDRKLKRIDAKFRARLDADLATLGALKRAQKTGAAQQRAAQAEEDDQKRALHDALVSIRDDIATTYPDDAAFQRLFGRGRKIRVAGVGALLALASDVTTVTGEAAIAARASDAGVTKKRLAAVRSLAAKVEAAKGEAIDARVAKRGSTQGRKAALARLKKDVAFARKVAALVFKGRPAVLVAFESTVPKHTVKARTSKPTA